MQIREEFSTFRDVALGLLVVLLVLMGIGGTIYKVLAPDGWIAQAFGRSLSAGAAALGSLLLVTTLAWFSRGRGTGRTRQRYSDVIVYAFAAVGVIYLAQFWLKGSF